GKPTPLAYLVQPINAPLFPQPRIARFNTRFNSKGSFPQTKASSPTPPTPSIYLTNQAASG
ncbi:hypothetical protein TNIN_140571, partial [Trichonephila inaurata madagascariensis]